MKVKTQKTTIDLTGEEIMEILKEKVSAAMNKEVAIGPENVTITYRYEKKEGSDNYKKTEQIKRVRITL